MGGSYMNIKVVLIFFIGFALSAASCARTQTLPAQIVPAELERWPAEREISGEPYPGLLLIPHDVTNDTDSKYNQPYHNVCGVYTAVKSGGGITHYERRFLVHAPDADSLPLAKRVARLLLLLYGANNERMRFDHPRTAPTVDVWLDRAEGAGLDADTGGEQFRNQIYFYKIFTERSPAEWAREVAHEYGHYALPGISGFAAPEEWANGVLGEKLFLKWLHDDLMANRLKPAAIPFVTPAQFEEYITRQVNPLVQRIAREGPNTKALSERGAAGMEAFVGLALYIDSVYGSKGLFDTFSYTEAPQGGVFAKTGDFVRGLELSLRSALEIRLSAPVPNAALTDSFFIFLPRGTWTAAAEGPVKKWELANEPKGLLSQTPSSVETSRAEWRKMTLRRTPPGQEAGHLVLHRRGTDVN